jgi:hypothetical protein
MAMGLYENFKKSKQKMEHHKQRRKSDINTKLQDRIEWNNSGDILSRPSSEKYRENYDRIFGKSGASRNIVQEESSEGAEEA